MGSGDIRHLIPLLHPETGVQDIDALRTWYEAVADGLRTVVAFDLFALWVYSPSGEPILIEPEALTQDNLEVPHAQPTAPLEALVAIEDRVRRAGYGSVLVHAIRHGKRDVGLIMLAGFGPHLFDAELDQAIGATLEVIAPMWPGDPPERRGDAWRWMRWLNSPVDCRRRSAPLAVLRYRAARHAGERNRRAGTPRDSCWRCIRDTGPAAARFTNC
jgi:hypothetical protein